jgi:hypothetical protein
MPPAFLDCFDGTPLATDRAAPTPIASITQLGEYEYAMKRINRIPMVRIVPRANRTRRARL